ncbi:hypothetical protein [Pontibacter russatus]|uniref:hypothetical protein n=1 Tax=Pontibacter russatus TaxID=2694929 RepID=UPI0013797B03|nr:hypothetical protein [Pontibacter russatus]
MIKNLTSHIPITTLILSYFFLCGGLHLYAFWSVFDIDISSLVGITDIPKSFIFPFLASQGFFLLNTLTHLLTAEGLDIFSDSSVMGKKQTKLGKILRRLRHPNVILALVVGLISYFAFDFKMNPLFWWISCISLVYALTYKITRLEKVMRLIPDGTLRYYTVSSLLFIPIFSFGFGRTSSLLIYNNNTLNLITVMAKDEEAVQLSDSLKFLGFIGDKAVAVSVDNENVIYINQSSIDQLQVHKKKVKKD